MMNFFGYLTFVYGHQLFVFDSFESGSGVIIDPGTPSGEDLNLAIQRMAIELH